MEMRRKRRAKETRRINRVMGRLATDQQMGNCENGFRRRLCCGGKWIEQNDTHRALLPRKPQLLPSITPWTCVRNAVGNKGIVHHLWFKSIFSLRLWIKQYCEDGIQMANSKDVWRRCSRGQCDWGGWITHIYNSTAAAWRDKEKDCSCREATSFTGNHMNLNYSSHWRTT